MTVVSLLLALCKYYWLQLYEKRNQTMGLGATQIPINLRVIWITVWIQKITCSFPIYLLCMRSLSALAFVLNYALSQIHLINVLTDYLTFYSAS